ncbi:hypothetical protein VTO73DRAFT_12588 [Trametes versicolor]
MFRLRVDGVACGMLIDWDLAVYAAEPQTHHGFEVASAIPVVAVGCGALSWAPGTPMVGLAVSSDSGSQHADFYNPWGTVQGYSHLATLCSVRTRFALEGLEAAAVDTCDSCLPLLRRVLLLSIYGKYSPL